LTSCSLQAASGEKPGGWSRRFAPLLAQATGVAMGKLLHEALSYELVGALFEVHKVLGPGLLESAYEGALVIELQQRGLSVGRQVVYPLEYKGQVAGAYIADLVVEDCIIVELKAVKSLNELMHAQLINYLRLSGLQVGYLVNMAGS
jgi:GxxExxY protein